MRNISERTSLVAFGGSLRKYAQTVAKSTFNALFKILWGDDEEDSFTFYEQLFEIIGKVEKDRVLANIMDLAGPSIIHLMKRLFSLLHIYMGLSSKFWTRWETQFLIEAQSRPIEEIETLSFKDVCALGATAKTEAVHNMMKAHILLSVAGPLLSAAFVHYSGEDISSLGK